VAHAPRDETPPQPESESSRRGLLDVGGLPLRVGRHVTAWVLWHTSRVSLLDDAPPSGDLERTVRA
jgi:hypothetical protein